MDGLVGGGARLRNRKVSRAAWLKILERGGVDPGTVVGPENFSGQPYLIDLDWLVG